MSKFFNKFHLATCAVHDVIWDAQNWFEDAPFPSLLAAIVAASLSLTIDIVKLGVFAIDKLFTGIHRGLNSFISLFKEKPKVTEIQPIEQHDDDQTKPDIHEQDWYKIIEYARFAPSPHNLQPWLFDIESENQATLKYDPQRLLPSTNPNGSYLFVGFGILFETMSIAAAKLGKNVEVTLADNVDLDATQIGTQTLATLKIVNRDTNIVENLDPQLILDRRTSRLPYNGAPLADNLLNELSAVAKQFGHTMGYSSDYRIVDWVINMNANAMHSDMSHGKTRNELRPWFRFKKSDAVKQADGLAAYTMNTSPFELWLFANVNWLFRIPGIAQLARRHYKNSMSGTGTVAWLSGPFSTRDDWVNAGRMMSRWWLTMTKHHVHLHPFGSVITNPEAFKLLNDKVQHAQLDIRTEEEKQTQPIWMLTRHGYSRPNEEPPQAQRMPLDKMIISSNRWCSLFKPRGQVLTVDFNNNRKGLTAKC